MELREIKKTPIKEFSLERAEEVGCDVDVRTLCEKFAGKPDVLVVVRDLKTNPGILGIITGGDLVEHLCKQGYVDFKGKDIRGIVNKEYQKVHANQTVDEVRQKLLDHGLNKIVIFNENDQPVGVITRSSLALQVRERASSRFSYKQTDLKQLSG